MAALVRALLLLVLLAFSCAAHAQYPAKPVRIVAPFAPGGLADVLARALGERLARSTGQPFVVENRPGAGGNVGADIVARAEPDGYTLLMSSAGILTINEFLYAQMPFNPATALQPVSVVAEMPMLLVVRAQLPAQSVAQFIEAAKREPGGLFFGSPGNGTTGHLGMELFMQATGIKLQHVPYKSAAEAVNAAIAGQTHAMFDNPPTVMAQIKAGALRALGVAAKERLAQLPDVPTIAEGGVKDFEASSWFGLVAPGKTPRAVVDRLAEETARAVKDPEMQGRFAQSGARLVGNTPDQFTAMVTTERARWEKIIRAAGIKAQ